MRLFYFFFPFPIYFPAFFLPSSKNFSFIHFAFSQSFCLRIVCFPLFSFLHPLHFSLFPSINNCSQQSSIQIKDETLARLTEYTNVQCSS
jgi:hypothetical protein